MLPEWAFNWFPLQTANCSLGVDKPEKRQRAIGGRVKGGRRGKSTEEYVFVPPTFRFRVLLQFLIIFANRAPANAIRFSATLRAAVLYARVNVNGPAPAPMGGDL